MSNIEALAIDFDGVLADSASAHTSAREEAFKILGLDVDPKLHLEAHRHGSHSSEIIGWILKEAGVVDPDADVIQSPIVQKVVIKKSRIFHEVAAEGLNTIDGVCEFIDWAQGNYGVENLAISTTASYENEVLPYLNRHNLREAFVVIVANEDTPDGMFKPHPYVYNKTLSFLGASPDIVAAIEDTPRGLESARDANIATRYGITTTHPAADLTVASSVVESFSDIQKHLVTPKEGKWLIIS